jgi:hypothetical protein
MRAEIETRDLVVGTLQKSLAETNLKGKGDPPPLAGWQ